MTRLPNRRHAASAVRGFTLIELMIVIAIIVVLVGLVLAVTTSLLRKSEERVTRNIMQTLDAAMQEWERQVDRKITFQPTASATGAYDVPFNPNLQNITGQSEGTMPAPYNSVLRAQRTLFLYELLSQQATVRDMLTKLPEENFRRVRTSAAVPVYFTIKEVLDGWSNPIYAVLPGHLFGSLTSQGVNDTGSADLDGTARCAQEIDVLGAANDPKAQCRNRRVLFVSAGPDGDITTTADNIYSYGEDNQ
ncbi:MAG: prepilin-type N-terminal cleavage/methylation domain-containing protein [Phycisphaerales bacterium]